MLTSLIILTFLYIAKWMCRRENVWFGECIISECGRKVYDDCYEAGEKGTIWGRKWYESLITRYKTHLREGAWTVIIVCHINLKKMLFIRCCRTTLKCADINFQFTYYISSINNNYISVFFLISFIISCASSALLPWNDFFPLSYVYFYLYL